MRRLKLLIQYSGTGYEGWQSQKTGNTIQDRITGCIYAITGEQAGLAGAGRTDAGVHALEQVAAFNTESHLSEDVLIRALNARLPGDIRIISVEEADPDFHPRFNSVKKRYTYLICTGRIISPFLGNYCWHIPYELDIEAMKKAASVLIGKQDFSSFRASGCSAKTSTRHLSLISIELRDSVEFLAFSLKGGFVAISMEADGFLRHMVRNIVGTLVEIGRGRLITDDMISVLNAKDRTKAGPTAPAQGLFLEKIFY